jgi:hypothetical protein
MPGGSDLTSLLFNNGRVIFKEWLTQKGASMRYELPLWIFRRLRFVVERDSSLFQPLVPIGMKQMQSIANYSYLSAVMERRELEWR